MIHAYDESCLDKAMESLGEMMEYASLDVGIPAGPFYQWFLISGISDRFGKGETSFIDGMSGAELARKVIFASTREQIEICPQLHADKGAEYWAGWAVAYYQWYCAGTFRVIEQAVPFTDIMAMYHPYHEMDITQFSDEMDRRMKEYGRTSQLQRLRRYASLTQKELSSSSDVPLRTIQQYEQGQKDIHRAASQTARSLSIGLMCRMEDLL